MPNEHRADPTPPPHHGQGRAGSKKESSSLRVSPALHPPERPSPRRADIADHGLGRETRERRYYIQEVVARTTCILRADLVLPFSAVTFVLLCFVFVILPFVKSFLVLRYGCAPTATHSYLPDNCLRPFSFSFLPFFISLEISLFPTIFVHFSLCMESISH